MFQDHGRAPANEKSLAMDNIFVFQMIFICFAVPPAFQKWVPMIGVIGAIVLRTVMILLGSWLVAQFHGEKFFTVENDKRIATPLLLVFIGTKMMLICLFKVPVGIAPGAVVAVLDVTMGLSLRYPPKSELRGAE